MNNNNNKDHTHKQNRKRKEERRAALLRAWASQNSKGVGWRGAEPSEALPPPRRGNQTNCQLIRSPPSSRETHRENQAKEAATATCPAKLPLCPADHSCLGLGPPGATAPLSPKMAWPPAPCSVRGPVRLSNK